MFFFLYYVYLTHYSNHVNYFFPWFYSFLFGGEDISLASVSCSFYIEHLVQLRFIIPQLLGLLGSMKGITSNSVASQCVLKLYEAGEIEVIDRNDPQQFTQFAANFVSDTDQPQACNFANFVPFGEDTPLQVIYLGKLSILVIQN